VKLFIHKTRQNAAEVNSATIFILNPNVPTRFPHNSEVALNKGHLVALFLEKFVQEDRSKNPCIMKFMESEMKCKSLGIHCLFKEVFL
jgi:hypothetical protein